MREHMSNGKGWVDHGPTKVPKEALAGPVRIPKGDGITVTRPPYTDKEVAAVIKQGYESPRMLTLEESRLRDKNKALARGDYSALDEWAQQQQEPDPVRAAHMRRYPTGTERYGHGPRWGVRERHELSEARRDRRLAQADPDA